MILDEGMPRTCWKQAGNHYAHLSVRVRMSRKCLEGCHLWEILAAGEWSSPAFLKYIDIHKLETKLVLQSHMDDSDAEPDT